MLKPYKTVSIVYGGSGAQYADQLNRLLITRAEEHRYPLVSKIVLENVLTGDLLANVIRLFTDSEYCVIFLTADDCCYVDGAPRYRVRQNVLLEMGMALFHMGRERCILLSDFDPKDPSYELPSDLKGMDVKCFTQDTRDAVFGDVLDKILKMQSEAHGLGAYAIPQYDHLLLRPDYFVDYQDLFAASSHFATQDGTEYLKAILAQWKAECKAFAHYEERCLYYFERICFVPMFGRHKWVYEWCVEMEELLSHFHDVDIAYCGTKKLSFLRNLAFAIGGFTRMKLRADYEPTRSDYEDLLEELIVEEPDEVGIKNPLAGIMYYDYVGLLHMCLYELDGEAENLDRATECFARIMDCYVEHVDMSLSIWSGFVGFNLARCYVKQFHRTKDVAYAEKAQKLFLKTSHVRKRWLGGVGFHSTIRNALSYEYFICKIEHINSLKLTSAKTQESITQELKRLDGELDSYMTQEEQLERLCYIQNVINDRLSSTEVADTLKEASL